MPFGIYFLLIVAAVAGVGILLFWSLRPRKKPATGGTPLEPIDIPGGHATYLPQMRQALHAADFAFLRSRGSAELSRRVRGERKRMVLRYLQALRSDFDQLIRLARVIAVLSPEIAPAQEWERLRLTVWFSLNCSLLTVRLRSGFAITSQLNGLSIRVSDLAMRIETAMAELGERAALASELASTLQS